MSHELLYTSAPKGLKSGSRGFCTVVCTQGMPVPLITALESLSAYRHVYPPGDRNAGKNPVAWSHLKMNVAGRSYHVLSRIADFGLDYSQRGNKLAHHLALETPEQTTGGPASLLEQSGNLETDWDGQPRLLPAGRHLRTGLRPPAVCTAWQAMTGDAGWAGVLAEAFLANPERQVYIVFEPGMDLLPLMAEAIGLLPTERRWEVTFSTYFTSLPPGVSCSWRCVLSGSPEAEQARKFGKALHIDLCHPVPPATGGSLVLAARTGRAAEPAIHSPQFATADADWTDDELACELELSPIEDEVPENSGAGEGVQISEYAPVPVAGTGYGVARPPGMPPPPPPPMPGRKRRTLADLTEADAATRSKRIRWVVASLAFVLVALAVGVFAIPKSRGWVLIQMDRLKKSDDLVAENEKTDDTRQGEEVAPETAQVDEPNSAPTDKTTNAGEIPKAKIEANERVDSSTTKISGNDSQADVPAPHELNGGSLKETATRPLPKFAGKELESIALKDESFEFYAINLQDAVNKNQALTIPVSDAKSTKWSLHRPDGRSDIKFTSTIDGSKKDITVLKAEGTVTAPSTVLTVLQSAREQNWEVRFEKPANGWENANWCLLSIESPDEKTRLFSLQEPQLQLIDHRFEGFSYQLQFDATDEKVPLPTIIVKSITLVSPDREDPLRFENTNDGGKTSSLDCQLPEQLAEAICFPKTNRQFSILVTRNDEKLTFKIAPIGIELDNIFDKGVQHRISEITTQYLQSAPQNPPKIELRQLTNEFKIGRSDKSPMPASTEWKRALSDEIDKLKREIKAAAKDSPELGKQQKVKAFTKIQNDLQSLDDSRTAYLKFKEGLKSAEISEMSLQYSFSVTIQRSRSDRPVVQQVPAYLEFRKSSR